MNWLAEVLKRNAASAVITQDSVHFFLVPAMGLDRQAIILWANYNHTMVLHRQGKRNYKLFASCVWKLHLIKQWLRVNRKLLNNYIQSRCFLYHYTQASTLNSQQSYLIKNEIHTQPTEILQRDFIWHTFILISMVKGRWPARAQHISYNNSLSNHQSPPSLLTLQKVAASPQFQHCCFQKTGQWKQASIWSNLGL